jgi:hypothetical protein
MSELELKINNIRIAMDRVLSNIDSLSYETYDALFPLMLESVKKMYIYRDELREKYDLDELLIYEKEFIEKTKLIGKKIDNTIEAYSKEKIRIERRISSLSAKKKLLIYRR